METSDNIYCCKIVKGRPCKYKRKCGDLCQRHYNEHNKKNKSNNSVEILQAFIRRYLTMSYNKLRGPALFNRKLCNNNTDIYTFDDINTIHPINFYSFLDNDRFIYGFDIASIYKYITISNKLNNPYNNNSISNEEINTIYKLYNYSKKDINYKEIENILPTNTEFILKSKVVDVFQKMDQLNNYTDIKWFYSLSFNNLFKFIESIKDLYNYRMDLTNTKKKSILKDGRIFNKLSYSKLSFMNLRLEVITEIDRLVSEGYTKDDKYLGSLIILTALTELVPSCASSYSWLVQSTFN
jgi:hypothetical protein